MYKAVLPIFLSIQFLFFQQVSADNYAIDTAHSKVGFEITHLVISTVEGRFNKFTGSYKYDKAAKKVSEIQFEIDASSIDTNQQKRDKHLRGEDFFNVKKYPKIEFKSVKVKFSGDRPNKLTGELHLNGKKKVLDFTVNWKGETQDPWGNKKQAFDISGKIKRSDFGLSWNKKLDTGGLLIGDEVQLRIRIQANKQ